MSNKFLRFYFWGSPFKRFILPRPKLAWGLVVAHFIGTVAVSAQVHRSINARQAQESKNNLRLLEEFVATKRSASLSS